MGISLKTQGRKEFLKTKKKKCINHKENKKMINSYILKTKAFHKSNSQYEQGGEKPHSRRKRDIYNI